MRLLAALLASALAGSPAIGLARTHQVPTSATRSHRADHSDPRNGWGRFECKTDQCLKKHPAGYWRHPLTARKRRSE